MANKKAMDKALLIVFLGILCMFSNMWITRIIGGIFGIIIWAVGIGLIIYGVKKYKRAKKE